METDAPLNEAFDIGLFTAEPGKGGFDAGDVSLFERRPIAVGRADADVHRPTREPSFAGVDPYNKWIDRNSDDNVRPVG